MSEPPGQPLLHARREGRRGRPPKGAILRHSPGTALAEVPDNGGPQRGDLVTISCAPRVLDLENAGRYLGVSAWTVRDLVRAGTLPRVRLPLPGGGELRKILVDLRDLDRLIDSWKDHA